MSTPKKIGLLGLALAGSFLYWRLGYSAGMPLLLFVMTLAVVGQGNRIVWSAVFPFLSCVLAAVLYTGFSLIPPEAEFAKLLIAFVLITAVPGLVLWLAHRFKIARNEKTRKESSLSVHAS
jgi:hypothetical protein